MILRSSDDRVNCFLSNVIGDASFIGIECESGIIDDCNDGTHDSVPYECSGIFLAPKKTTQCGSQCQLPNPNLRSDYKVKEKNETGKYWLYYKRKIQNLKSIIDTHASSHWWHLWLHTIKLKKKTKLENNYESSRWSLIFDIWALKELRSYF